MTNIDRARALLLSEGWSPEEAEKVVEALRPVLDAAYNPVKKAPAPVVAPPTDGPVEV